MIPFSFEYFIFLLNLFFYDLLLHSTLGCKNHSYRAFRKVSSIFAITPRKARDIPDHVFCCACARMSLDSVPRSAIVGHRLCAFSNTLGILFFFQNGYHQQHLRIHTSFFLAHIWYCTFQFCKSPGPILPFWLFFLLSLPLSLSPMCVSSLYSISDMETNVPMAKFSRVESRGERGNERCFAGFLALALLLQSP